MTNRIAIYTDGACRGNPGPGGWGVFIPQGLDGQGEPLRLCGGEERTTNQRMELDAALQALRLLDERDVDFNAVELVSDSQYVIKGISQWLAGWVRNGWVTGAGKPVANDDLWRAVYDTLAGRYIRCRWVKGHQGDSGNEEADRLAREGAQGRTSETVLPPAQEFPYKTAYAVSVAGFRGAAEAVAVFRYPKAAAECASQCVQWELGGDVETHPLGAQVAASLPPAPRTWTHGPILLHQRR